MGPAELVPIAKTKREENQHYRAMARDKECQLRVPFVCNRNPETTVLCHSNWHDKGGARKASDFWGVWGCYACHTWLDQGNAPSEAKYMAFSRAMDRMKVELEKIVSDPAQKARDREAAAWALERLAVAAN